MKERIVTWVCYVKREIAIKKMTEMITVKDGALKMNTAPTVMKASFKM